MSVGEPSDDGGSNGLAEGEETAHGAAQQHDVVPRADGPREGILVGIEPGECAREEGRAVGGVDLTVAVEFKKAGE